MAADEYVAQRQPLLQRLDEMSYIEDVSVLLAEIKNCIATLMIERLI